MPVLVLLYVFDVCVLLFVLRVLRHETEIGLFQAGVTMFVATVVGWIAFWGLVSLIDETVAVAWIFVAAASAAVMALTIAFLLSLILGGSLRQTGFAATVFFGIRVAVILGYFVLLSVIR